MKFGLNSKGQVHQELIHAYVSSSVYISLKVRSRLQKINFYRKPQFEGKFRILWNCGVNPCEFPTYNWRRNGVRRELFPLRNRSPPTLKKLLGVKGDKRKEAPTCFVAERQNQLSREKRKQTHQNKTNNLRDFTKQADLFQLDLLSQNGKPRKTSPRGVHPAEMARRYFERTYGIQVAGDLRSLCPLAQI